MVVPLADPPVGTRGRPFLDRFASAFDGRSQVADLEEVLEKGRREIEAACCDVDDLFQGRTLREVERGRKGFGVIESFSN